ncbi:MAG: hypothetical protein R2873_34885 [Caldilineaceae bacterium]
MHKRQFLLATAYGRLPNSYMQYYYFREETVAEAQAAPQTRAQSIMATMGSYYAPLRRATGRGHAAVDAW